MAWVWSQGRGWIEYPGTDERSPLDRFAGPTAADILCDYSRLVDDRMTDVYNIADDVSRLLSDSSRLDAESLHDDELRRVLAEVVDEVREARRTLGAITGDSDANERLSAAYADAKARIAEAS